AVDAAADGNKAKEEWAAWASGAATIRNLLVKACADPEKAGYESVQKARAELLERNRDEIFAALPVFAREPAMRSKAAGATFADPLPHLAGPKNADKLIAFLDAIPSEARDAAPGAVAGALRAADSLVADAAGRALERGVVSLHLLAERMPDLC